MTEAERNQERIQRADEERQQPITDFLAKRTLNAQQIAEMRRLNLEVMTTCNVPLGFFSKAAMKNRGERLLEICGYNKEDASKVQPLLQFHLAK